MVGGVSLFSYVIFFWGIFSAVRNFWPVVRLPKTKMEPMSSVGGVEKVEGLWYAMNALVHFVRPAS